MQRLGMIALSLGLTLTLALGTAGHLLAQDAKKEDAKPADAKPADVKPADAKPADTKPAAEPKKDEAKPAAKAEAEAAPKPIPPEVEAKLEAARRAVAEAIVAAQDAGLVDTSMDQPPILDILITGRATDKAALKAQKGVSPEVFGAWFTNHSVPIEGITAQADVRIFQPSEGLKDLYDARDGVLRRHIDAARKAKAAANPAPAETKKEVAKPAETKKEEAKPAEKKDEAKPAEKKDEAKPAEKKEETKPAEKKEEAKPAEKKEESKPAEKKD